MKCVLFLLWSWSPETHFRVQLLYTNVSSFLLNNFHLSSLLCFSHPAKLVVITLCYGVDTRPEISI